MQILLLDEKYKFKDNSYDVVFSIGLMEHFKK